MTQTDSTEASPIQGAATVGIVEDDDYTREFVRRAIERHPRLTVIGDAPNLAAGKALLAMAPAALLVDLGLPDGSGLDLIAAAAHEFPQTEVLVLSVFGDEEHVIAAVEAGATGYLLKDSDEVTIAESVLLALDGGSPINPTIARHVLRRFRAPLAVQSAGTSAVTDAETSGPVADEPVEHNLSPRETEILTLLARGCAYKDIARMLDLSYHTVSTHIKRTYRKLAVRSQGEAVFEATQLGIIEPPGKSDA